MKSWISYIVMMSYLDLYQHIYVITQSSLMESPSMHSLTKTELT